nr:hypothetical protein [Falsirhodobacter deserti]
MAHLFLFTDKTFMVCLADGDIPKGDTPGSLTLGRYDGKLLVRAAAISHFDDAMVCFTTGTMIDTPDGPRKRWMPERSRFAGRGSARFRRRARWPHQLHRLRHRQRHAPAAFAPAPRADPGQPGRDHVRRGGGSSAPPSIW